uniref:Opsin n=1 Tax=Triops granarius TaxID=109777 RepID=B6EUW4_9CRUS|nr:opsin [Triops granarius]
MMHNFSEPRYEAQVVRYGDFAPGVSVRDMAPENVRYMVHLHWEKFPPPDPRVHTALGALYLIMGVMSAVGNVLVLYIFGKYKSLRSPTNVLVMNLAFCDLGLFVGLYPELLGNIFINNGPWMWGDVACKIHAWCGLAFGFGQMQTLMFVSMDRYYVIVKGLKAPPLTYWKVSVWLAMVWIVSIFWATSPFFGFGNLSVDGLLNTCSYDYYTRDLPTVAYIVGSCVHAYVLPLAVIIFCYSYIVQAVFHHERQLREQAAKMNVASLRSSGGKQDEMSAEFRIAKIALINCCLWLWAWTPFTVISFMGVLHDDQSIINPYVSSLPVLLAKTSAVYNPIVYGLSHPKFQQCLREEFGWNIGLPKKKDNDSKSVTSVETAMT